jgi:hypothetical protein
MCNKSDTIGKIAQALVAFSGEVKSIAKDATNPHFKSQYTSLDHMIDETKPLLQKHGLTVMQFPGGDGEKITIRTMILHTSGEWIESEPLTLKAVKIDPQGAGSAITYGRRYSYAAALSLSLGDDDDGNSSSQPPNKPVQAQQPRSEQTHQQPSRQPQTNQTATLNSKSRAINLMNEMKWDWNTLGTFASEALGRKIGKVLSDIKTEEEWKIVADALETTMAAQV